MTTNNENNNHIDQFEIGEIFELYEEDEYNALLNSSNFNMIKPPPPPPPNKFMWVGKMPELLSEPTQANHTQYTAFNIEEQKNVNFWIENTLPANESFKEIIKARIMQTLMLQQASTNREIMLRKFSSAYSQIMAVTPIDLTEGGELPDFISLPVKKNKNKKRKKSK